MLVHLLSPELIPDGDDKEGEILPLVVLSEVTKGSVLSPLLFNIYMRSLSKLICPSGMSIYQYANEFQFYISAPGELNNAMDVLSQQLETEHLNGEQQASNDPWHD